MGFFTAIAASFTLSFESFFGGDNTAKLNNRYYLSDDLTQIDTEPQVLFYAKDAPWSVPIPFAKQEFGLDGENYFSDGPYVLYNEKNEQERVKMTVQTLQEVRHLKIHIIGCSGSGKTYLAKALSEKLKIPHFDLDDIQWDNHADGYGIKMPMEKRNALLQEILKYDAWIIEGVYYAWVQESFEMADKIYVLDMPEYLYKSRIIIRSIKRKLGIEKGKKETIKSIYSLLKWTDTFQKKNLNEIRNMLEKYGDKVEWISSKRKVDKLILTL